LEIGLLTSVLAFDPTTDIITDSKLNIFQWYCHFVSYTTRRWLAVIADRTAYTTYGTV